MAVITGMAAPGKAVQVLSKPVSEKRHQGEQEAWAGERTLVHE